MRRTERPHPLAALAPLALAGGLLTSSAAAQDSADTASERPVRTLVLQPDGTWAEGPEGRAGDALRALTAGELERAHALLGELLFERRLGEARAAIDAADPARALVRLDDAARLFPRDERMLLLRGEAYLQLGRQGIERGYAVDFTQGAFSDALAAYRGGGRNATSRLGMARAAYLLNDSETAARHAEQARALLDDPDAEGPTRAPDGLAPERVIADAIYLAYADEAQRAIDRLPEADGTREQALFDRAQDALDALIAVAPDEAGTWNLGVDLMLFRAAARDDDGARADALALLERGLDRNPTDATLADRLVDVARGAGGLEGSVAALRRHLDRRPNSGITVERLARELFELGMRDFPAADRPAAEYAAALERFEAAEAQWERIPTDPVVQPGVDPRRARGDAAAARSWRVVCRLARGWVHYWAGDLDEATAAFSATEELASNGLDVYLPDRLSSARTGLEYVVAKHVEQEDLISAASVAGFLHARYPEDADLANNAGFLNRDAATALENLGQAYCRASTGEVDAATVERLLAGLELDPERALELDDEGRRALFADEADRLLRKATRTMRASGRAYVEAARLAPADVRVQNDTALVFVYYLHTDLEQAEERLLAAVELGEQQLAAADALDDQALYELENAWGDAHENLGVLALEHRGDAGAAERWFRRAVEIGPDPRPIVSEYWLARVAAVRAGETPEPSLVALWGRPCP